MKIPTKADVAAARKAVVAGIGAALVLVTSAVSEFSSLIPANDVRWVNVGVAAVTAVSVYLVKNATVIDNIGK